MSFNNNKDFDLNSYVKVNERLEKFRKDYPEGRITTEFREFADGVLAKTVVCRNINDAQEYALTGVAPATGHAFLLKADFGDKVLEMTETTAIGRCLAVLGYEVSKSIASFEEMKRFTTIKAATAQDSKVTVRQANTTPTPESEGGVVEDPSSSATPLPKLKTVSRFNVSKIAKKD